MKCDNCGKEIHDVTADRSSGIIICKDCERGKKAETPVDQEPEEGWQSRWNRNVY